MARIKEFSFLWSDAWKYIDNGYDTILEISASGNVMLRCLVNGKIQNIELTEIEDASDYAKLPGEVYLLTTEGMVTNADVYKNIYVVNPTEIYQFATNPYKAHIIPENVLYWVKFLTDVENTKIAGSECKGIMFDTNRSYSDTNEYEMLAQSKIAAYGDASRYINSFHRGDYVLYYSKGRGIIAVGRIKSDDVVSVDDEKYHEVDLIVPDEFDGNVDTLLSLSPAEIKAVLDRNFYWASTIKTPFLNLDQVDLLIKELKNKY